MKHAWGLPRAHFHWAGGNAYEPVKTMNIIESLIFTGKIGIVVDSRTKMGDDSLSGTITAGTSSNGLIRFDGVVRGPLSRKSGWFYAAGAYVNYDPTNVNAPGRAFVDQKQIYQFLLSKRWKNSVLDMSYRFSLCDDNVDNGYSVAPFVYKGDGSIDTYNGFSIGRDCYMPADDLVSWLDLASGETLSSSLSKMDRRLLHDILLRYSHHTASDWDLSATYHACRMSPSRFTKIGLSSITDDGGNYSFADGRAFSGKVQNRLVTVESMNTFDNNLLLEARKVFATHKLRMGMDFVYALQHEAGSTFNFAHSVQANPARLNFNGAQTWNYNRNGVYFDGQRLNAAIYAMDDWKVGSRLIFRTGVRLNYVNNTVQCLPYEKETGVNDRKSGNFYLGAPNVQLREKSLTGLDYAVSENISWRIAGRLFFNVEGFYSMTNKATTYFKGANSPSVKPIGNAYARGGLSWDNDWMDNTGVVSFITSWNNAKVMDVSDSETGEVIPWTAEYGIRTLGVTLDGNLHFGGFKLHLLGTWQDPRYRNYRN